MHGVGQGKRQRKYRSLSYCY